MLRSSRSIASASRRSVNTRLFVSDDAPDTTEDELREVRDMVVQAYYISTGFGWPSQACPRCA